MSYNSVHPPLSAGSFYKYKSFYEPDSPQRQVHRQIIVERQLWFAKPSTLNDPDDCHPVFTFEGNVRDRRNLVKNYYVRAAKARGLRIPKPKVNAEVSRIMSESSTSKGRSRLHQDFFEENTGVFCMSREDTIAEQWNDYSDGHRGLCYEFTISPRKRFEPVYEVWYEKEVPTIDMNVLFANGEEKTFALMKAVRTKTKKWASEDEVRAITMSPGLRPYPAGMLTAIVFGRDATPENIEWCRRLVKDSDQDPKVFKMIESDGKLCRKAI